MAILVFCVVFLISVFVTDVVVIQPFHLYQFLHVPQLLIWGVVLTLFAWIFGDDSSPWV